jgi:hypothetical protein
MCVVCAALTAATQHESGSLSRLHWWIQRGARRRVRRVLQRADARATLQHSGLACVACEQRAHVQEQRRARTAHHQRTAAAAGCWAICKAVTNKKKTFHSVR